MARPVRRRRQPPQQGLALVLGIGLIVLILVALLYSVISANREVLTDSINQRILRAPLRAQDMFVAQSQVKFDICYAKLNFVGIDQRRPKVSEEMTEEEVVQAWNKLAETGANLLKKQLRDTTVKEVHVELYDNEVLVGTAKVKVK
jgi:hypothetical protein